MSALQVQQGRSLRLYTNELQELAKLQSLVYCMNQTKRLMEN